MNPRPQRPDNPAAPNTEFRNAVADARPLRAPARAAPSAPKPVARARFTAAARREILELSLATDPAILDEEIGDTVSYRRAGVQPAVVRKLRRGEYRIEAQIDLHGLSAGDARAALRRFLAEALARRLRSVRIVHGKGLRSGQRGPVIKRQTLAMLQQISAVQAYCSARAVDGGTGALYVLLAP